MTTTTPPPSELPQGYRVRLGRLVRAYDAGATLVGGTPTTVAFLSTSAANSILGGEVTVHDQESRALVERLVDLGMADPVNDKLPPVDLASVTVVVPVRDRSQELGRLLESINPGVPVVVVDDGSENPEAVRQVAEGHGAQYLRHLANLGPAAARNTGMARVRTGLVAFVDSDVLLNANTLPVLAKHFVDDRVGLVAPRILGHRERDTWLTRYEDARSSLDLGARPSAITPGGPVSWVPSACVLARRDALGDGFSPELRVAEDVDLVWRLADQGWRMRYEPASFVRHQHRAGFREWWNRKVYYGTGAQQLAVRHGTKVAPAVLSPWTATVAVALLAQRRWSVPVAALATVLATERINAKVAKSAQSRRVSTRLALDGVGATLNQTSALLLRHWWPAAAALSLVSPRIRRAVAIAAVVDSTIEYRRTDSDLDPVRFAVARRLDDLAYGSGVWLGAARHRSFKCLVPNLRITGSSSAKDGTDNHPAEWTGIVRRAKHCGSKERATHGVRRTGGDPQG
jgi:mycofactocin system glycosyltransferase